MDFLRPGTLAGALSAKADRPDAVPIAGGTDVMVEINFDARRPAALLDLNPVTELTQVATENGRLRVGATVSYTQIITGLGRELPGLAMASRTVGSPQIRNRGTVGGNLGAASPAGDTHPVLLACDALIEAASVRGTRLIPAAEFYAGPKRNVLAPDELITAFWIAPAAGPQQFAKIGTRNAMVIAVCSFALSLWPGGRPGGSASFAGTTPYGAGGTVGTGIGSAGPVPLRAVAAEDFLTDELAAAGLWESRGTLPDTVARRFGELVAGAASPIDDVRGSAAYRRHALSVLARRTLGWAWESYRKEAGQCG
ncbi:MAG TPA: FAD binding domain-containing protein [Streptosporangiaceae bacterium]|nr:FAD binding domain-containing protein [Streptosporangiaceae bacterium]